MVWVKRILMALVALAVLGAVAYGFVPQPVAVETAAVTRGELLVSIDQEAYTRVKDRFVISAPASGSLERITLRAGDHLEQGAVIALLTPLAPALLDARARAEARARVSAAQARVSAAQAAIDAAQAELDFAEAELARARRLFAGNHVSKEAVDAARLRDAAARSSLESARFNHQAAGHDLDMARAILLAGDAEDEAATLPIPAPVSGRILRVFRESAGPVTAGAALVEVGNPASLEVVAEVLSRDAVRAKPGMSVRLERWGGETLRGRVRLIEPSGFTKISALGVEEQRVNVLIDFVDPPEKWEALGDQYRVEARIVTVERPNTVKVPTGAVFNTEEGPAAFVAVNGRASLRRLRVGYRGGPEVEIMSGLNEGERVIVHPGGEVKDGGRVTER